MNHKRNLMYLFAVAVMLAVSFASFSAVAKNDGSNKGNKSNKSSQSQNKSKKQVNLKNFQKPNKAAGQTNAQVHKEKTQAVVKNLEQVATREESAGNTEVSDPIEEAVAEQERNQNETSEAIGELENRSKIKTFLVGTGYKNLGQLRSSLVHNRNEIRKITQAMNQASLATDPLATTDSTILTSATLQQQLETLMQERERIKVIITTNEEAFSLFGWVSRFLANYEQTPINQEEEDNLTEEVEDAINNSVSDTTDRKENFDKKSLSTRLFLLKTKFFIERL